MRSVGHGRPIRLRLSHGYEPAISFAASGRGLGGGEAADRRPGRDGHFERRRVGTGHDGNPVLPATGGQVALLAIRRRARDGERGAIRDPAQYRRAVDTYREREARKHVA